VAKVKEEIIVADEVMVEDKPEIMVEPEMVIEDSVSEREETKVDPAIAKMAEGMNTLTEAMARQLERDEERAKPLPKVTKAFPKQDIAALKKSLKDNIFDNPDEEIEKFVNAAILNQVGPPLQKIIAENTALRRAVGKQSLGESDRGVVEKWGAEVDELANNMEYTAAIKEVKLNHLDEIIEERINAVPQTHGEPTYTGAGRTGAPVRSGGTVKYVTTGGNTMEEFNKVLKTRSISREQLAKHWLNTGKLKEVRS